VNALPDSLDEPLALPPLPWRAARRNRQQLKQRGPFLLVTSAHPSLQEHRLGPHLHPQLGRLLQPRHTSSAEATAAARLPWAADNDCFQGLDPQAYYRMLDRLAPLAENCLWVSVPDVVGDTVETARRFELWAEACKRRGLPAALVAQDGLEGMGRWLDRSWHRIDCLFMGGTTAWKEGLLAAALAREAQARGIWVHWGRVNSKRRFDLLCATGALDSFDGTQFARFRHTHLDKGLGWAHSEWQARLWRPR